MNNYSSSNEASMDGDVSDWSDVSEEAVDLLSQADQEEEHWNGIRHERLSSPHQSVCYYRRLCFCCCCCKEIDGDVNDGKPARLIHQSPLSIFHWRGRRPPDLPSLNQQILELVEEGGGASPW
uniref:Uncharacterized protein n=1 Tax=Ditylenchus dipsaci TaxID=166011 RepID=A0A915DJA4_9BILA